MYAIILLGPPGSGKGTVAEKIRDLCGYIHVSTGDMLRDAIKQGTSIGREAEGYMKKGELVPDSLIMKIVETKIDAGTVETRYLFDGFPRTIEQADLLGRGIDARKGKILRVFLLEAPRNILIERLTGRRVCRKCGAVFHIINVPPKRPGICDVCGGELYQRSDDQEATIANRLDVYNRQTESLIAYYKNKNLLEEVDSNRKAELTIADMVNRIRGLK